MKELEMLIIDIKDAVKLTNYMIEFFNDGSEDNYKNKITYSWKKRELERVLHDCELLFEYVGDGIMKAPSKESIEATYERVIYILEE